MKLTLTSILFWAILVVACFLNENVALFTTSMRNGFDTLSFTILAIVVAVLLIFYYFLEKKKNNIKFNYVLLPIFLIIMVLGLVSIWIEPSSITFEGVRKVVVNLTAKDKMYASIELILSLAIIYACFTSRKINNIKARKMVNWLGYATVIVMLIFFMISFITEGDLYYRFFNPIDQDDYVSIGARTMVNSNIYSTGFFIAILMLIIIDNEKPSWINHLLMFILFFANLFTGCSSTLFILCFAVAIYFVYRVIKGFVRKRIKKTIIGMMVGLFIIAATIAVLFIGKYNETSFAFRIYRVFVRLIKTTDFVSFTNRKPIWEKVLSLVNESPLYLTFGRGHGVSKLIMKGYSSSMSEDGSYFVSAHGAFYEIILRYGIIGAVIYSLVLIYYLGCIIYLFFFKKMRSFALMYLLTFAAILTHSVVESDLFMNVEVKDLVVSLVLFYPPIYEVYHLRHQEHVEEYKQMPIIKQDKMSVKSVQKLTIYVILSLLVSTLVLLAVPTAFTWKHTYQVVIVGLVILISSLIFFPLFISSSYQKRTSKHFIIEMLVSLFILLLSEALVSLLCLYVIPLRKVYFLLACFVYILLLSIGYFYFQVYKKTKEERQSFKEMFALYKTLNFAPILITMIFGIIAVLILGNVKVFNGLNYLLIMLFLWLFSLALLLLMRVKERDYYLIYFNNLKTNQMIRTANKED